MEFERKICRPCSFWMRKYSKKNLRADSTSVQGGVFFFLWTHPVWAAQYVVLSICAVKVSSFFSLFSFLSVAVLGAVTSGQ